MRLGEFILANTKQIVSEWVEFARSFAAGRTLNLDDLRDHAEAILIRIAQDLASAQSSAHRADKSRGKRDVELGDETPASSHGAARGLKGFTAQDVVAEYRALRASVLRLWAEAKTTVSSEGLEDINHFNEAIDQALAESIDRYLHDLEQSKDMFLGILGHDLRNPLGAIVMSASAMIEDSAVRSATHARRCDLILRSGLRMEQIIRDLLDFTRSHLGSGIPITRVGMNLEEVCRQTVEELAAFHPERVLRFQAKGELRGRWDSDRIAQVLSNLVGNAIQHGFPDAPITISLSGRAKDVCIAVHNWGTPIPPARQREVFIPMRRVATASNSDRTSLGLGLYIAHEVVLAHGGSIDVESSAERGTTFTVRLPRREQQEHAHRVTH
jgi:signal transduction histidine kinase